MTKHGAVMVVLAALWFRPAAAESPPGDSAEPRVEERSPVWLGAFITSTAIAAVGLSVYVYSAKAIDDEVTQIRVEDVTGTSGTITDQDCGNPNIRDAAGHFEAACAWSSRSRVAFFTTAVAVPFAVFTGYLAFRSLPKAEKRRVAVVPTVTTQSAGALLDIRW